MLLLPSSLLLLGKLCHTNFDCCVDKMASWNESWRDLTGYVWIGLKFEWEIKFYALDIAKKLIPGVNKVMLLVMYSKNASLLTVKIKGASLFSKS